MGICDWVGKYYYVVGFDVEIVMIFDEMDFVDFLDVKLVMGCVEIG